MKKSTIKQMWTKAKLNNGQTVDHGLGFGMTPFRNHRRAGHSGGAAGFATTITRLIDDKVTVIVLTNADREGRCSYGNGKWKGNRQKIIRYGGIEHKVPFTHQTVVRMPYSEGREFIAIATVLMEQDRVLKLDDKVRKYFPRLPEWSDGVTIWDLLNHRSGFADEWAELLLTQNSMANRFVPSQFLNLLYNQPAPSVEPGKDYMYSNSDFALLRIILEKASGQNLAVWMKKRIFDPLKMISTRLHDNPLEVIPNFAVRYFWVGDKKYRIGLPDKTSPGGNYYIAASADDLEKWAAAHTNSTTDIAKATARLIANVRILPGKENHYVVGYSYRNSNNQRLVLHEGVNEYNYLTRIPEKGLAVITLGNREGGYGGNNISIVNYLLKVPAEPKPQFLTKPVSVSKEELAKYEGRYRWQEQKSWESYSEVKKRETFL